MTVDVRLDVHDIANSATPLGTLSEAYGRAMLPDLFGRGGMSFAVDLASTADVALLEPRRVVRWHVRYDGGAWIETEAFLIDDRPTVLASDDERPAMAVTGQGLLGWLGYDRGGALLRPRGGLNGANPRLFGPMSEDYVPAVPPWGEPTSGGLVTRAGFPDRKAERFIFTSKAAYRRVLTGQPSRVGPSVMWFTSSQHVEATFYLDGDPVMTSPRGSRDVFEHRLDYDGETHVAYIQATQQGTVAPAVVWSWATIDGDDDDETYFGLFRTFTEAVFGSGFTAPAWLAIEDADVPGVTRGFIMKTAVDEAQDRGLLPAMTTDIGIVNDSHGVPWADTIAHAFRMQTLGRLDDDLSGLMPGETWMTPGGMLRCAQRRGTDRSATVTVALPFGAQVSRDGPRLTRGVHETPGGLGEFGPTGEATYGPMEDLLTFGSGLGPDELVAAVQDHLARFATERSEVDLELPDDVKPYDNVFLGDTATVQVGDLNAPYRLTSFMLADDTTTGQPEWSATGTPDV